MIYVLHSPVRVSVSKNKDFILNINHYRNFNRFSLGKAKDNYTEMMREQIIQLPRLSKIRVRYIVYQPTKAKCDLMNIVSIHSKFFLDALQKHKRIVDDNYEYVLGEETAWGGVDKENPRVEIELWEAHV